MPQTAPVTTVSPIVSGGELGLLGVAIDPAFAGMGLFKHLVRDGVRRLAPFVDSIEGLTHVNNRPVQRGYARLGWDLADGRHALHLWLEDAAC